MPPLLIADRRNPRVENIVKRTPRVNDVSHKAGWIERGGGIIYQR